MRRVDRFVEQFFGGLAIGLVIVIALAGLHWWASGGQPTNCPAYTPDLCRHVEHIDRVVSATTMPPRIVVRPRPTVPASLAGQIESQVTHLEATCAVGFSIVVSVGNDGVVAVDGKCNARN